MTVKYGLLTAEDEWASEYEVYDFLYALVRLLKPKVILETGCYKGGGTKALVNGCKANGFGTVNSCDTSHERIEEADAACENWHSLYFGHCDGVFHCQNTKDVDLAFIDSSGDRVAEVEALNLAPGGVVVLHDSNRPQYKRIWELKPWKSIWHIPTEQGITVFQS